MTSPTGAEAPQPREPQTLINVIQDLELRKAQEIPVELFIMGPHIDPNVADRKLDPSALLRKELLQRAWDDDHFGVSPGLDQLFQLVTEHWDPVPDLCTIELSYARAATVLVFIPASNGSAAEIGFFSAIADMGRSKKDSSIGPKSVIFFDRKYEDSPGFVARGPAELLSARGAKVAHIDYQDHDGAWAEVKEMISRVRADAVRRGFFQ